MKKFATRLGIFVFLALSATLVTYIGATVEPTPLEGEGEGEGEVAEYFDMDAGAEELSMCEETMDVLCQVQDSCDMMSYEECSEAVAEEDFCPTEVDDALIEQCRDALLNLDCDEKLPMECWKLQ